MTTSSTFEGIETIHGKGNFSVRVLRAFVTACSNEEAGSTSATQENAIKPESATGHSDATDWIALRLADLLNSCDGESIEAGIESLPARALKNLIQNYKDEVITEIACQLNGKSLDPDVFQEILSWLGQISHTTTHAHRRWLLEKALLNESETIRYGSLIGLSFLDDPKSLPSVRRAMKIETN